ncbi:MAG: hypothetical protein GXO30_08875 [Epsilonproteobacteria bacterium]|nr:hypothetical protein [Campylobacterota bacterium]
MSMGLKKLLDIGVNTIHEQTHITKKHIDAVFNERFEEMSRVQFLGFISIFQREYGVKLEDLKQKGLEYYNQKITTISEDSNVFISPEKKKNFSLLYAGIAVVLFLIILLVSFLGLSGSTQEIVVDVVDNTTIKSAQLNMKNYKKSFDIVKPEVKKDINITVDENITKTKELDDEFLPVKQEVKKVFKINPKRKVWFGYIDLSTHKKYQKVLREELELDTKKEWLLIFGHSNVKFDVDGNIMKFKTKYNLRLLYKDSKLTELTVEEFKKLNRGKKW